MSKVNAYRCDYCGQIKTEDKVVGISKIQDLFDALHSYKVINNPDKADVHGCTDCYNYCLSEANSINRKKYEQLYIDKRTENGLMFRQQCVLNALNGKYTPPKLSVNAKTMQELE
jgi:hypothetical protein